MIAMYVPPRAPDRRRWLGTDGARRRASTAREQADRRTGHAVPTWHRVTPVASYAELGLDKKTARVAQQLAVG
jgi:hypothetical protein